MDFVALLSYKFPGCDFQSYVDFCVSKGGVLEGEDHHILPECHFPEHARNKENLVKLSYKDHARAHYLLFNCCPCSEYALAFDVMLKVSPFQSRDISSLDHEVFDAIGSARKVVAENMSARMLKLNKEGRNPNLGKIRSSETRVRMSEAQRGSRRSDESIAKQKESVKRFHADGGYQILACPHCGVTGKSSGMKSWHFEYCKQNPNREERKRNNHGD